ncbi:14611_t:CDS:2, partial [Cetraspora pellucida]
MSTTSTSAPSTPINNIKNLAYNILKTLKNSIVKGKKIPNLSNCSKCGKEIILYPLKAFTTLSCGHVFHRLCIEKKLLFTIPNTCPFSGCSEEVEIIETGHRRGSESSTSSVVRRMKKHSNRPTDQSIIPLEKESRKRPSKDTSENKLSSKKVKTKDRNVSMLKKLIEELKSPSSLTSSTTSQAESITSPSNFSHLYNAIVKAEERIESVNQEIIICYFAFGKKLKERLAEYMKDNKEHRSQRKLYKEVKKQLPSNLSKNAIEKKIERARKIYDLFSSIGEDKIQWVRSYSALRISKLSWDEIDAIEEDLNTVRDWIYVKVIEHYHAKLQKDQRQVLDSIKKDLQKVVLDFEFDKTKRKKAQEILNQWKNWTAQKPKLECSSTASDVHLQ